MYNFQHENKSPSPHHVGQHQQNTNSHNHHSNRGSYHVPMKSHLFGCRRFYKYNTFINKVMIVMFYKKIIYKMSAFCMIGCYSLNQCTVMFIVNKDINLKLISAATSVLHKEVNIIMIHDNYVVVDVLLFFCTAHSLQMHCYCYYDFFCDNEIKTIHSSCP